MSGKMIWKFPIPFLDAAERLTDRPEITMPVGSKLLTAQMQGDTPTVWALVDPEKPAAPRRLAIIGTGQDVRDDVAVDRYVGTYQAGPYVFHVFEAYS